MPAVRLWGQSERATAANGAQVCIARGSQALDFGQKPASYTGLAAGAPVIRHRTVITASSYLAMLFVGVSVAIIGASARDVGLDAVQIGLLLAAEHAGFAMAVAISGFLADLWPKPPLLVFGSLVLGISFGSLFASPDFAVNLVVMVGVGIGVGTYEGVTDALLLDIHSRRQSLHISVNHVFVTLGSLGISAWLFAASSQWRTSMRVSAVGVAALGLVFAMSRPDRPPPVHASHIEALRRLPNKRGVLLLCLAAALSVGMEVGSIGILTTFMSETFGSSDRGSKLALLLFLVGVLGGRLLVALVTRERWLAHVLTGLMALCSLTFSALFFAHSTSATYVLAVVAGASLSAQVPLILGIVGRLYPGVQGSIIGAVKTAFPIGGALTPLCMSTLARWASFEFSLAVLPLSGLFGALLVGSQLRRLNAVPRHSKPAAF